MFQLSDETPEDNNNEELFNSLNAGLPDEAAQSWIQFNEVYRGLLAGGFSPEEALTILTNLMWKMMNGEAP